MNETQYNATIKAQHAARLLAKKFALVPPFFFMPHGDPEITANRALVAIGDFLDELSKIDLPPARIVTLNEMVQSSTLDELSAIPGIGPTTAKRILRERE